MKVKFLTSQAAKRAAQGFTLIEMIGVLAVIAILAAVLIPKVFEAINNAKVNNAAMSCQTVKTAIIDHYAKVGSLTASTNGSLAVPTNNFDAVLLGEGFLDKLFAVKIGDSTANTQIELDTAEAATVTPLAPATPSLTTHVAGCSAFNLDGANPVNDAVGSSVVYAVITGVNLNDARDLNARVDGTSATLGESVSTAGSESDVAGRVKYTFTGGATTTVYVYLTHR